MKRLTQMHFSFANMEKKWLIPLAFCSLGSLFLLVIDFNTGNIYTQNTLNSILTTFRFGDVLGSSKTVFAESKVVLPAPVARPGPPRFAYLISGSKGDGGKLKRTLASLYHPLNQYVVHLDRESSPKERVDLANYVRSNPIFAEVGNVHMITKANMITYKGPTMVSNTLHAAAILLRKSKEWDWFINLSASDYPLVTQDGSAWMVLSRAFIEYCVWGWDNLPRTVLMYYANFVSSPEGYFHTVICNTQEFRNTTVNHDLHYISWDNPPKQHPHSLGLGDSPKMIDSKAPFARKFHGDDPVLDKIDKELLGRQNGRFTPGGWCKGNNDNVSDPCSAIGDTNFLKPGLGAKRLGELIKDLLSPKKLAQTQCK